MRVLLTNNTLSARAGSELYLRDIALGLLARGHQPTAFSTVLGPVADELRRAAVPVIDDLAQVAGPPDVIHGHHHLETMMAALCFPDVPAVSFCHGFLPWEEGPARSPNVRRYVAVDAACRERLLADGIPADRIDVILNFVDLRRFAARPALPSQPRRALVFSNGATERSVAPMRAACARRGMTVDVIGARAGVTTVAPENVLGSYDVVFAKARSALEALAVGCGVVLCDGERAGPLVTSADFDRLRDLNFGFRTLTAPLSVRHCTAELARFDAADAARVSARVRAEAGLDRTLDRLIELYERLRATPPEIATSAQQIGQAAAAYLAYLAPRIKSYRDRRGVAFEIARALPIAGPIARRLSKLVNRT
jgi:glycosyl transferase family 4